MFIVVLMFAWAGIVWAPLVALMLLFRDKLLYGDTRFHGPPIEQAVGQGILAVLSIGGFIGAAAYSYELAFWVGLSYLGVIAITSVLAYIVFCWLDC